MSRHGLWLSALIPLLASGCGHDPPNPSCKPNPPLTLEARLEGSPPGPFDIVAHARSPLEGPIDLAVVLPEGVSPRAGSQISRGRRPQVRLNVCARDACRREILVRATLREGSACVTCVASLVLNDAPRPSLGVLKRNARGENILEFNP